MEVKQIIDVITVKEVKQILIVRKDLNMRKGKIAAQCAHASLAVLLNGSAFSQNQENKKLVDVKLVIDEATKEWLDRSFAKICLYVNSEHELCELKHAADQAGIKNYLIVDSGKTEFHGVQTKTVLAIGPDFSEKIDKLTGNLPLL